MFYHIENLQQNIPFPKELMTQLHCRKAEEKTKETTVLTGCPCKVIGYVGQYAGEQLLAPTVLLFELCLCEENQ